VVGYEVTHDESEHEHCEVLKPTAEQFAAYLQEIAKEKAIKKCSE